MESRNSIRFKLMRVILVTSAAVLILTFSFFFLYEFISYRQITLTQLVTLSDIVASNSTAALAFDSPDDANEILAALKAGQNITGACIYDRNGKVFAVYPNALSGKDIPKQLGKDGFVYARDGIEGFIPITQGKIRLGTLYIKRNLNDLEERLTVYSLIAVVAMCVSFVLVYLLSIRLQKGISAPIVALSETTRAVTLHNNYSIRAIKQTEDEIGYLTDAFNTMLTQIEIQNSEIEASRQAAQKHALELEIKVNERTIEYKTQKDFAETVVNSSLVLITVYDTETRIIGYNKKCEEEFGLTRADVLGKKYADVFPGIRDTLTYSSLLRCLKGETIHNHQYKSGVTGNYYESYMVPLRDEQDHIYAVLMTANNITQVVETSEMLKNNNIELLSKNEELEQFAYVASHDLQEPLRKIRIFIQLMRTNKDDYAAIEKYMERVELAAERMTSLIRDVLEYSRLSKLQETFTEIDLNYILQNIKSDFELLITQRDATIINETLPIIRGNGLQLHQLFANLISNSIKFCDTKPVITITATTLKKDQVAGFTDLNPQQKYVVLNFIDNGIGFEQEYADKIFTIFQRLNTREKYEGTGIGLALCKKIVQNHSGHISVVSSPGRGTEFSIILPCEAIDVS